MVEQITNPVSETIRPEMLSQSMLVVELETVAKVSAAVTRITDLDVLLQTVVDLTKSSFELYHAHIYLIDEAHQALVLAAGAGEAGAAMKARSHHIALDLVHSLVARCARSGQAIVIADVRAEPDFLPNALLPETRSEMVVPLIINQEVIGVLDVQSQLVGRFGPADVRVKTILADQIAVAVENARSFNRIQQSTLALQLRDRAIDLSTSGFMMVDMSQPDMPLIYVNAAYERITGYSAAEVIGRSPLFLQADARNQPELETLHAALAAGQDCLVTLRNYRKDGTLFWNELKMSPVYGNSSQLTHYVGISNDVTARRQAEEEALLLYEVSTRLAAGRNSTDILEALNIYPRSTGAVRSLLFYNDVDSAGQMWSELAAFWTDTTQPATQGLAQLSIGFRMEVNRLSLGRLSMASDESPLLIRNAQTDTRLSAFEQQTFKTGRLTSIIVVPFKSLGRWLGFAVFEWETEYPFTNHDMHQYEVIMRQASPSVDATRAYKEAQNQIALADQLTNINVALAQASTEAEILSAAALIFDVETTAVLSLAYLTCDAAGQPIEAHNMAIWRGALLRRRIRPPVSLNRLWEMSFSEARNRSCFLKTL